MKQREEERRRKEEEKAKQVITPFISFVNERTMDRTFDCLREISFD